MVVRHFIFVAAVGLALVGVGTSVSAQTVPPVSGWFKLPVTPSAPQPDTPDVLPPSSGSGLIAGPGEQFVVIPLKYADVSEIVGLLTGNQTIKPNDGFIPQEPNFGSSSTQGYFGGTGALPTVPMFNMASAVSGNSDPMGQAIDTTIGIDRRLNAVVLRGSPERIAAIREQIAQLDVPVTSVILETEFVELSETGARNLGLDFSNGNNQIGTASIVYSRGFPGISDTPRFGGVTAGFQVALNAQISKGEGRIVSKPRIAAQSGTTAKIITGDALPILTSIALSGVNAVQQQVQYVNVGVTLQIAPRVSNDGFVTAHIYAVVSSVTGFSQGYPTISQREATTSATVRDGEPFVIGGLTQESRITNKSKLPILGDIPLLGTLFQVEHSSKTKRDLYIVVTPHIVRGEAPTPEAVKAP